MSKDKIKTSLIAVMISINCIILYKYIDLRRNTIATQMCEYINPSKHKYVKLKYLGNDVDISKFNIVSFFNDNICFPCVKGEIEELVRLKSEIDIGHKIYYKGEKIKEIKAAFPGLDIQKYNGGINCLNIDYDFFQHATFVIDKNKNVLDIFRSEAGVPYKTEIFYRNLKSFLERKSSN